MDQPDEKPADLKASRNVQALKTGHDRPKLSILQYNGMVYGAAGTTYGADKYARANYFGPRPEGVAPVDRFLEYLDAAMRHIGKIAHAINVAKGTRGDQIAACALPDDEASGGFPASNLPHIAHAIAGLMIAVECGVADGLLPADPGQPWRRDPLYAEALARRGAPTAIPQKDNPDAEHARVTATGLPDKIPNTTEGRAVFDGLAPDQQTAYRPCIGDERLEPHAIRGPVLRVGDAKRELRIADTVRVVDDGHLDGSDHRPGSEGRIVQVDSDPTTYTYTYRVAFDHSYCGARYTWYSASQLELIAAASAVLPVNGPPDRAVRDTCAKVDWSEP